MTDPEPTFYWLDYETFGTSPRWDRPSQFAGRRTTLDLEPVGDPLVCFCRLPGDYLPNPEACQVTGLSPQEVHSRGTPEAGFIARVVAELGKPGTCTVGYNSIRFDDEFTRHALFRNFHDAYAHEWQNGNSRWDLLDIVRLTRALRPENIEWPCHADGAPSNKLEHITAANGIEHADAHDALSDVDATLAVARLIRRHQPRLFDYCFAHRDKHSAATLLNTQERVPCVHVSTLVPARHGHVAIVMPLLRHPTNRNAVIVLDLRDDPAALAGLDADTIAGRVFDKAAGGLRPGLLTVSINRCPVLVPLNALREADAARLDIDLARHRSHADTLLSLDLPRLCEQVGAAMVREWDDEPIDVDGSLYGGAFFNDADRRTMARIRAAAPAGLASLAPVFDDARLDEMFFRYRARNYPNTLTDDESERWLQHCSDRLHASGSPWLTLAAYRECLDALDWAPAHAELHARLTAFGETMESALVPASSDNIEKS